MFAVAIVPIVALAGVGLDWSHALSSRNALQNAMDATALALAHLPANTPQDALDLKAQQWLQANLNDPTIAGLTLVADSETGSITLVADAHVLTTLSGLIGLTQFPIHAESEVRWGATRIEVALVLDNTGSMLEGDKLAQLKTAAVDLVETLDETTDRTHDANALKLSVVPFSMTVRLGTPAQNLSYRAANWMDGSANFSSDIFTTTGTDRFAMFDNLGKVWSGCVESRVQPYDVQDTAPTSATPATLFHPFFAPDEPDDHSWWGDAYPNNYMDDYTSSSSWSVKQGNVAKYVPTASPAYTPSVRAGTNGAGYEFGPNAGCTMEPLLRLTTDVAAVKTKLNAMQAVGETNIPMGLMWGWHTLSPNAPFGDGGAYGDLNIKKIVVLLTDGHNTMTDTSTSDDSIYGGLGYIWQGRLGITSGSSSTRTNAMNTRMGLVCTNMKTAGVVVYAVRIDVDGAPPAALSGCASSPTKFYDIDSDDLSDAFEAIAGSIGQLRIAR
jgi:Flp pilus assembly protein TadG